MIYGDELYEAAFCQSRGGAISMVHRSSSGDDYRGSGESVIKDFIFSKFPISNISEVFDFLS